MTNQQGAPEALRPIQRFNNIFGLMNPEARGLYVRYEDHVAALVEAQQPTTHVQNPAEIEHAAGDVSKNGAESDMAQQPAPSAACPVDNNNFDHQTAADVLNGKTVSDEAMRKFVAVARWAHDDRVGLRATLLSVRGELASREAEIALLKKALMDAEAPQPTPTAQPAPAATPQADSQPAPEYVGNGMFKGETIEKAAEHWANWCDVRCMMGLSEFLRVVAAHAPAESQPAPVLAYPPLPRVGAIGYASVVNIESYAKTLTIGPHLPGVRDIALWTTDQMRAYADATHALRASHGQASSQAGEYPALVCDYCGALTPDPWHSSGMLHGKMSKHIHSCDACAARGAAQAQDTREPLTDEQIQDLLLCGNPTDEEMRLIRIGWDAANGIKGGQHGAE